MDVVMLGALLECNSDHLGMEGKMTCFLMESLIKVSGMIQRQDLVVENRVRNNAENAEVAYVSSKPSPVVLSSLGIRLREECM